MQPLSEKLDALFALPGCPFSENEQAVLKAVAAALLEPFERIAAALEGIEMNTRPK